MYKQMFGIVFSLIFLTSVYAVDSDKSTLAQIDYEERIKNKKGILFSLNNIFEWVFEKLSGNYQDEQDELSVSIVEPVTDYGTHLKINSQDKYIPSGGTLYSDGWLIRHRGNIEDPNGTIYSDINSFYVGIDNECSMSDHYECIGGNLHWLYCNGTDYGVVEECDACGTNECIKKGTFARYDRINAYKKNNSLKVKAEGETVPKIENDLAETAISGK